MLVSTRCVELHLRLDGLCHAPATDVGLVHHADDGVGELSFCGRELRHLVVRRVAVAQAFDSFSQLGDHEHDHLAVVALGAGFPETLVLGVLVAVSIFMLVKRIKARKAAKALTAPAEDQE